MPVAKVANELSTTPPSASTYETRYVKGYGNYQNMNEIVVRRASASDIDALVEFNQGIALETEGMQLDSKTLRTGIGHLLSDESLGFYFVAEIGDRVAGCLMVTFEWSDWRNAVFWWIQSVYVHADFRRQGVYRALYEHVQTEAASENVCGFRLYVEKDNEIAQKTYESLGMRESVYLMYEQPTEKVTIYP